MPLSTLFWFQTHNILHWKICTFLPKSKNIKFPLAFSKNHPKLSKRLHGLHLNLCHLLAVHSASDHSFLSCYVDFVLYAVQQTLYVVANKINHFIIELENLSRFDHYFNNFIREKEQINPNNGSERFVQVVVVMGVIMISATVGMLLRQIKSL